MFLHDKLLTKKKMHTVVSKREKKQRTCQLTTVFDKITSFFRYVCKYVYFHICVHNDTTKPDTPFLFDIRRLVLVAVCM